MINQILQLISVHFKEFIRQPGIIFWSVFFPILMAWGLGIAFTKKGELIRTVAIVQNDSQINNSLSTLLKGKSEVLDEYVKLGNNELGITTYHMVSSNWDNAIDMLKQGKTSIIIKQENGGLEYHFDPMNPEAQLSYLQLYSEINGVKIDAQKSTIKPMSQEGTRYIDFLIPGLMAMGIMMSCMWGISYTNVDKRMKKLMRRMVATPMKKSSYLIAQITSRIILSAVESFLLVFFAYLYFDISIQGSLLALLVIFLAGNFAFSGIAILTSSRTDNSQVANGLINLVVMPMMVMSGVFFSYHNFPDWAVSFIQLLPLTMLADQTRNIFISGIGLVDILPQAAILTGLGLVMFTAGIKMYKWY